jgi:hypothetical protein
MWEILEWPPRSPKSAWLFVGVVFFVSLFGLIVAFVCA